MQESVFMMGKISTIQSLKNSSSHASERSLPVSPSPSYKALRSLTKEFHIFQVTKNSQKPKMPIRGILKKSPSSSPSSSSFHSPGHSPGHSPSHSQHRRNYYANSLNKITRQKFSSSRRVRSQTPRTSKEEIRRRSSPKTPCSSPPVSPRSSLNRKKSLVSSGVRPFTSKSEKSQCARNPRSRTPLRGILKKSPSSSPSSSSLHSPSQSHHDRCPLYYTPPIFNRYSRQFAPQFTEIDLSRRSRAQSAQASLRGILKRSPSTSPSSSPSYCPSHSKHHKVYPNSSPSIRQSRIHRPERTRHIQDELTWNWREPMPRASQIALRRFTPNLPSCSAPCSASVHPYHNNLMPIFLVTRKTDSCGRRGCRDPQCVENAKYDASSRRYEPICSCSTFRRMSVPLSLTYSPVIISPAPYHQRSMRNRTRKVCSAGTPDEPSRNMKPRSPKTSHQEIRLNTPQKSPHPSPQLSPRQSRRLSSGPCLTPQGSNKNFRPHSPKTEKNDANKPSRQHSPKASQDQCRRYIPGKSPTRLPRRQNLQQKGALWTPPVRNTGIIKPLPSNHNWQKIDLPKNFKPQTTKLVKPEIRKHLSPKPTSPPSISFRHSHEYKISQNNNNISTSSKHSKLVTTKYGKVELSRTHKSTQEEIRKRLLPKPTKSPSRLTRKHIQLTKLSPTCSADKTNKQTKSLTPLSQSLEFTPLGKSFQEKPSCVSERDQKELVRQSSGGLPISRAPQHYESPYYCPLDSITNLQPLKPKFELARYLKLLTPKMSEDDLCKYLPPDPMISPLRQSRIDTQRRSITAGNNSTHTNKLSKQLTQKLKDHLPVRSQSSKSSQESISKHLSPKSPYLSPVLTPKHSHHRPNSACLCTSRSNIHSLNEKTFDLMRFSKLQGSTSSKHEVNKVLVKKTQNTSAHLAPKSTSQQQASPLASCPLRSIVSPPNPKVDPLDFSKYTKILPPKKPREEEKKRSQTPKTPRPTSTHSHTPSQKVPSKDKQTESSVTQMWKKGETKSGPKKLQPQSSKSSQENINCLSNKSSVSPQQSKHTQVETKTLYLEGFRSQSPPKLCSCSSADVQTATVSSEESSRVVISSSSSVLTKHNASKKKHSLSQLNSAWHSASAKYSPNKKLKSSSAKCSCTQFSIPSYTPPVTSKPKSSSSTQSSSIPCPLRDVKGLSGDVIRLPSSINAISEAPCSRSLSTIYSGHSSQTLRSFMDTPPLPSPQASSEKSLFHQPNLSPKLPAKIFYSETSSSSPPSKSTRRVPPSRYRSPSPNLSENSVHGVSMRRTKSFSSGRSPSPSRKQTKARSITPTLSPNRSSSSSLRVSHEQSTHPSEVSATTITEEDSSLMCTCPSFQQQQSVSMPFQQPQPPPPPRALFSHSRQWSSQSSRCSNNSNQWNRQTRQRQPCSTHLFQRNRSVTHHHHCNRITRLTTRDRSHHHHCRRRFYSK